MCNGSGAEQDWTGINWLRKSYPVEEKPQGDTGNSFSALSWEDGCHNLTAIYFPNTFDISWLKSLTCVMNDLCHGFLSPDSVYVFSSACFGSN